MTEAAEAWSIRADEERALSETRALKHGDLFGVFDLRGDVPDGPGVHGIYLGSTRFLSRLELRVCGTRPLLLGSTVREGNDQLVVDLTNGDLPLGSGFTLRRDVLHLFRMRFVLDGVWYERIEMRNFEVEPVTVVLDFAYGSDWADIFEIRGTPRSRRGRPLETVVEDCAVELGYDGADGVRRHTRLEFSARPERLDGSCASFRFELQPGEETQLFVRIVCTEDERPAALSPCDPRRHRAAFDRARSALVDARREPCRVSSSNEAFEHWLLRSVQDLQMLVTRTEHGPYPYAGIPWFATVFGRDGILTAFECLWWKPALAAGVLTYLAAEQAREYDPTADAEPGKILHERRRGEMAALGEVPFGKYYGSVDATPLFVVLAGAYLQRTGDLDLVRRLWPNIERALRWIEQEGDRNGDGFLDYARREATGLANQGWKDSWDSVSHADGSLAEGPIALCEVQAYTFAAWREAARIAEALGHTDRARAMRDRSVVLASRFEEAFWCPSLGTYALALDGERRPCMVRASNAAHCLAFGIAGPQHAESVADLLLDPVLFSGWGIRTLATCERRYNPMGYHNGTVWPHDNAIAAYGLSRYGRQDLAARLLEAMFDASRFLDLNRLPELFCGFERREGRGPTLYPVSCAPQAWAAGAVFLLLQSCLGLGVDGRRQRVVVRNPRLPACLPDVRIQDLRVGKADLDLLFIRHDDENVSVQVLRRVGDCQVVVEK